MPLFLLAAFAVAAAPADEPRWKWVVSWAGSVQGPYPVGNPSAQPDMKLALPSPETGAHDQSFRLIVKPEIWGREARLRFSNAFGHEAGELRRRVRRPAPDQLRGGRRHQPGGDLPRQEARHDRARALDVERRGAPAVRAQSLGRRAGGTQARGELPRPGRERAR